MRDGEKGACSSSGVLRGYLDQPKVNTSVQEGRAPEQHSQHGVEGRATKTPDTKGQLEQAKKTGCQIQAHAHHPEENGRTQENIGR